MTIDDDLLLAYALGSLTSEEEQAVGAHLQRHPEDAAKVQADLESLTLLTLALPPEPLAAAAEDALLARVRGLTAAPSAGVSDATSELPPVLKVPPQRTRSGWWALAAAALLGGIYLAVLGPPGAAPEVTVAEQLERFEGEPGALSYRLADETSGAPLGTLVRLSDGRLFVALETPPAAESVYQAWEIREGTPISLGTFDGRTLLTEATEASSVFGLSVEPPGGSEQPTTTPFVVQEL